MLARAVASKFCITRWVIGAVAVLAFAPFTASAQVAFSVGTGGTHGTIQDAVNACPPTGCVINLTDSVYRLNREIWIEAKNSLTIQASPSLQLAGTKPRLYGGGNDFTVAGTGADPTDTARTRPAGWKTWPNTCQNTPGGSKNTSNPNSTSGFQHNGMIVVYKSTNVRIEGIMLDGTAPKTFVNKGIWDCKWEVLFGNVGVNIFQSKKVVLRSNEIRNFYSSIYMQNRNVGGAFAAPNPDDLDTKDIIPYSRFGKVGDHLIEKNYIHHNWWGIYDEMEWDIGSTIRYNILDSNSNLKFAATKDSSADANNHVGGFIFLKDVTIVPHKIYNNTVNGSSLVMGHGYFKPGVQHYFYNNLLSNWYRGTKDQAEQMGQERQILGWYKNFMYHNTFEIASDSGLQVQPQTSGNVNDSAACAVSTQKAPCWINFDAPVRVFTGYQMNQALWNGWEFAQGGYYTASFQAAPYTIYNNQVVDIFGTNASGIIKTAQGVGTVKVDISAQKNYWARNINFISMKRGTPGYLEPKWGDPTVDSTVLDNGWDAAGNKDQDGSQVDRGAIPKAKGALISPLTLKDQTIVYLNPTAKTVSFDYCLEGTGGWADIKLETIQYYNNIARSRAKRAGDPNSQDTVKPFPDWPNPVKLTNTGGAPAVGQCKTFKASLPIAPVDSFARFDLIFSGTLNGQTVRSNVGVWIWRKTQYVLDVSFTLKGTNTVVDSTRVGVPVDMHVKALRTDGTPVTLPIDLLAASPDVVTFLANGDKLINQGDTIARNIPAAGTTIPVYFTQTGPASVALSGMIGTLPVPGGATIRVKPGLPESVEWQSPASYKFIDRTKLMDSTAATIPQSPTLVKLQVKDKWGNNVDTVGDVSISTKQIDPFITNLSFATAASGPFGAGVAGGPWTFASDGTGAVQVYIMAKGVAGQKFWGFANVVGKTAIDTALMKLGVMSERLYFTPVVAIDTFVTIRRKVHVILSDDGTTPKVGSSWSTAFIQLRSKLGVKFYASETAPTPIPGDSIALVAGEADVWVTSDVPVTADTLVTFHPLVGGGLPASYAPVSFRMPPVPPSPVPDTASFLDLNCDGKADVARLWLKATTTSGAALDTTKVQPELILVKYPNGTIDSIGPKQWKAVGGNFSVLDLTLSKAPLGSNPQGSLSMTVRLRRPPAADTIVPVGTAIVVADRVSPRPTAGAIVENFSPGVLADTVRVAFSEPVSYTGTTWPFQTREVPAGTIVNASAIVVAPMSAAAATSLTFVITGNAAGIIHAGQSIAIDSSALLVDVSGNHGKGSECLGDTAILALVAQPVPMVTSWMKDADGDGRADRLVVVFRRALRAVDIPDKFDVAWGSTKTVDLAFATTTDSITWTIPFADPFPKGLTAGTFAGGTGRLTFSDGVGAIARTETIPILDSVSPIPVSAGLRYGIGGASDTLLVTYSEPVKIVSGTAWMLDQRLADAPIATSAASAVGADGDRISFLVNAADANYPRPGDSIRLPAGAASNLADARGVLPSSPTSPYVEVAAPPIPMVRSAITDANGDGSADRATVVFLRKLRPVDMPDSLVLTWGTETRSVRFAGATTTDSLTWVFAIGTPFTKGVTAGAAADGAGSTTLRKGFGASGRNESIALADSVAPIPTAASLRYGASGVQDTLVVTYSEPLVRKAGSAWMLDQQASNGAVSIISGASSSGETVWSLLIDASASVYPHPGDSVRLPSGSASNLADARGILPTSPNSPYVVVVGPPVPLVSSYLRDSDGDGRADQVTATFLKKLRASDLPDSLVLSWGDETRSVRIAGSSTTDSIVWSASIPSPFRKGLTAGSGANGSGSTTLRKNIGAVSRTETIALADSVAPIPVFAELRYGSAGASDTLVVRYSEPVSKRSGTQWMLNQRGGDAPVGIASGSSASEATTWNLLVNPTQSATVHPGDSIRLPAGAASNLVDARGVLPTSPKSPYVLVVGGDRPPQVAWYIDRNGDGQVDRVVLQFADTLTSNPTYVFKWGAETRAADTSDYGGAAVGKTRLEIVLKTPFAYGVTASATSSGEQTSFMAGASPSVAGFPIRDSVPPVILRARVGYSVDGGSDTLFLKLSEPVRVEGSTPVMGRGNDGNAYMIGSGKSSARVDVLADPSDSILFFCDTSCVDGPTSAGMPDNGDSIRLSLPSGYVRVQDVNGNTPGAEAKWTRVTAGDRPYVYVVNIYPGGVLVEGKDFVPNREIKSKNALSTWILKDGRWWEFKDGQMTGQSYPIGGNGVKGEIELNGVGLKVDINGPFDATLMLYDNLGTYIGTEVVVIDSATAKALGNSAGKFSILFLFNGRTGGPDKIASSGVYLIRYLTFRNELQANGIRQRRVLENKIYKLGRKGSEQ